ncbi:MAG: serine/threonine protein phosphatase [Polyangiaceae bacterium]|nr:serine/threonine protein phosphatase [Polyangiaceae bacterium]
MPGRTFAIGDVHGGYDELLELLSRLPRLTASDTLVFLGDYIDRGPRSAEVVEHVRRLPERTPAKVVTLRGNHEDAWLRVIDGGGWAQFVSPLSNGCLATLRSYQGEPPPGDDEAPSSEELKTLLSGSFFPREVLEWMRALPLYYEDEHAIYVHAGLTKGPHGWLHPDATRVKLALLWCRDADFFRNYRGKLVVFGHTATALLPPELSTYTPEDPADLWAGPSAIGVDTGCGKTGFLTAVELPAKRVYESR